jgi:hypothetical protein
MFCTYTSDEDDSDEETSIDYPDTEDRDLMELEEDFRIDYWAPAPRPEHSPPRRSMPSPYGLRYSAQCCLCLESKFVLCYTERESIVPVPYNEITLSMLYDVGLKEGAHLPEDILLGGPCGTPDHNVCVQCLRHTLRNIREQSVLGEDNRLPCLYPFGTERCTGKYKWYHFDRVLTFDEYKDLMTYLRKHRSTLPCPTCRGLVQVSSGRPTFLAGYNILECHMTMACKPFCMDCGRTLLPDENCETCLLHSEKAHPEAYNMYLVPDSDSRDSGETFPFRRNREWTVDKILKQIADIASADRIRLRCPCCDVVMERTVACNALRHCNVERCNVCGRCSMPGKRLDSVHWQTCPRFDEDWARLWHVPHPCTGHPCHSHENDCAWPEHRSGLQYVRDKTREIRISKLLDSLTSDTRARVLEAMKTNENNRMR